jgi:hypothetical protein
MAFSFTVHNTIPKDEICGLVIGHSMSPNSIVRTRANEAQFGTTLTIFIHQFTTTIDHLILLVGGLGYGKVDQPRRLKRRSLNQLVKYIESLVLSQ